MRAAPQQSSRGRKEQGGGPSAWGRLGRSEGTTWRGHYGREEMPSEGGWTVLPQGQRPPGGFPAGALRPPQPLSFLCKASRDGPADTE